MASSVNFASPLITASYPTATPGAAAYSESGGVDRRQVRPLDAADMTSYTAALESNVRLLEQEVQLLRTGLQQNEAIARAAASSSGASRAPPLQRRTVSLSRRKPAAAPAVAAQPGVLSSSAALSGPKIAFGQRVVSTTSRYRPPDPLPSQPQQQLSVPTVSAAIPLQGTGSGATIYPTGSTAAVPAASSAPPAIWSASCFPSRQSTPPRTAAVSRMLQSINQTQSSHCKHNPAPASSTASPIVVAMSTDGPLPTQVEMKGQPSPPSLPIPVPPPPSSSQLVQTSSSTKSMENAALEIKTLQDALQQRSVLLHRVLEELQTRQSQCSANRRTGALFSAQKMAEPSSDCTTLHLLTDELLAAQVQLSQLRASYDVCAAKLRACEMQAARSGVATSPAPAVAPPTGTPAPAPAAEPAVDAAATEPPPSAPPLASQLAQALRKLQAWEEWYASNQTTIAAAVAATTTETKTPAETNGASKREKKKERRHREKAVAREGGGGQHHYHAGMYCPRCGTAPGAAGQPAYSTASPMPLSVPPYISTYTHGDAGKTTTSTATAGPGNGAALRPKQQLHSNGNEENVAAWLHRQLIQPGAVAAAAVGASTPPSAPNAGSDPPKKAQLSEQHVVSQSMQCSGQYIAHIAYEAAVREIAEAEREAAEHRLMNLLRFRQEQTEAEALQKSPLD